MIANNIGTEYAASAIYKNLTIEEDEIKMIIDVNFCASWWSGASRKRKEQPSTWGLLVYNPEAETYASTTGGWFHHIIVFTPKPGLFDETPPQ
ncbi:MAG: hypothetical protein LBG04_00850 [Holosporaceae bacterium]|nr:hypothetical protein [Holosporaceae bacterium]